MFYKEKCNVKAKVGEVYYKFCYKNKIPLSKFRNQIGFLFNNC